MPPDAPDEGPPQPPPPPEAEGGNCPRCGTPYEPGQEYCLECGLRLPVARGIVPVLSAAWRRRLRWYPGDWIWPVLLFFVIAALGAAAAILATSDDNGSASKTLVGTTEPAPGGTGTVPGEPAPPPTGTTGEPPPPPPTETQPVEPPPPPPPSGPIEWPAGQSGYTVVLVSLPESGGRPAGLRAARKAIADGLSDVGVLSSSDYSSLHPGYYVIFSGIYSTEDEAKAGLETARATYPQAYTRQITQ